MRQAIRTPFTFHHTKNHRVLFRHVTSQHVTGCRASSLQDHYITGRKTTQYNTLIVTYRLIVYICLHTFILYTFIETSALWLSWSLPAKRTV